MRLLFKRRKFRVQTTLPVDHPMNYLGVPADPVIISLRVFGQVLILVPAPAPLYLTDEEVYVEGLRIFDLTDTDVIPSYYYKRREASLSYVRV